VLLPEEDCAWTSRVIAARMPANVTPFVCNGHRSEGIRLMAPEFARRSIDIVPGGIVVPCL